MTSEQNEKTNTPELKVSSLCDTAPGRVVLRVWNELPHWQQLDSNYIETGYRYQTPSLPNSMEVLSSDPPVATRSPESGSYLESLKSWQYIHNETVNIFSHLIGSVLFFTLHVWMFRELRSRYSTASLADVLVFTIYLCGVAVCFAFSTIFHTVMNHSANAFAWGIQLDFQGILLLMWGATIPIIYYAFVCEPRLRVVYWTTISCIASACSIFTFSPAFRTQSPFVRPLRAALFGGFALSAIIPVAHSIALYGWTAQNYRVSLCYVAGVMVFNSTGAAAYALKFPERYFPRTFDIVGASHQIMHVMVLGAAIIHVFGLLRNFDNLHGQPLACPA